MNIIQKEIEFDAGHRVPLHASKCRNPHGHRYKVQVGIVGELITEGPESGMVRDFSIVKEILTERVHDLYDHGFIVSDRDQEMIKLFTQPDGHGGTEPVNGYKVIFVPFYPTAECLAQAIFNDLKANGLPGLLYVRLWETPTSMAEYKRG